MSVGGIVGGIIGFWVGGPSGAQWGYAIGSGLEASQQTVTSYGPRLSDLKITISSQGVSVPEVWGAMRVSLNIIATSGLIEKKKTESQSGKGGPTQETVTYTYMSSYAGVLCEGGADGITGVRKYYSNGTLVFDAGAGASAGTLVASNMQARDLKFYRGTQDQMPDPRIESYHGAGNVPAWRGTAYVSWGRRLLTDWGNTIPNDTAEVVRAGEPTIEAVEWEGAYGSDGSGTVGEQCACIEPATDEIVIFPKTADTILGVYSLDLTGKILQGTITPGFDFGSGGVVSYFRGNSDEPSVLVGTGGLDPMFVEPPIYVNRTATGFQLSGEYVQVPGDGLRHRWSKHGQYLAMCGNGGDEETVRLYRDGVLIETLDIGAWIHAVLVTGSYVYLFCGDEVNGTQFTVYRRELEDLSAVDDFTWTVSYGEPVLIFSVLADSQIWIYLDEVFYLFDGDDTITEELEVNITGTLTAFTRSGAIFNALTLVEGANLTPVTINPDAITASDPTVGEIVSDLWTQVDGAPSEIDVDELTDTVRGFVRSRQMSADAAIKPLMMAFKFDKKEDRRVVTFVKRGGTSARTINYDDLVVTGDDKETLPITRTPEEELPQKVTVISTDPDNDYQQISESRQRYTTTSKLVVSIDLTAIAMSPDDAATIAQVTLDEAWIERDQYGPFCTTMAHADVEETDVITIAAQDRDHVLRVTKKAYRQGYIEFYGVACDPLVYDRTAVGSSAAATPQNIRMVDQTLMLPLDIPILQDEDNDAGLYLATSPRGPHWRGAVLKRALDDESPYSQIGAVSQEGILGYASTVLATWTGPNIFDEGGSVTVVLTGEGELESATRDALFADRTVNVALIGDEVIRFRTATLTGTKTYLLTGLLRGQLGTEHAVGTHVANERFVLLQTSGTVRYNAGLGDLNSERFYKAVSNGRTELNSPTVPFTNTGIGLKPYAPQFVRGTRDGSNNLTIGFARRTRFETLIAGTQGLHAPLGEATEAYEIDIYGSGSYTTVLRTISVTDEQAAYTAAQQTADGLTPGNTVYAKVYQISQSVGRGYPSTASV